MRNHQFDLTGKVAIITGSGRGLGRTIAAAGAAVVVCARSLDEAERTASAIRDTGGTALPYGAAKAALNHVTRVTALEWAPRHIRVNAIAPGPMENVMRDGFMTDIDKVRATTPLGRSDAASSVTGTVLYVDGGTTAV